MTRPATVTNMRRISLWLLCLGLGITGTLTHGQLKDLDPDWKENDVKALPAFDLSRLVEIDMGRNFALVYAIDPATLDIGSDGILRYVMVARSKSGAINAFYEGLRCETAEARVYARHNPSSGWQTSSDSKWQPLRETAGMLHALRLARQGGCDGSGPPRSADAVVRQLKNGRTELYLR